MKIRIFTFAILPAVLLFGGCRWTSDKTDSVQGVLQDEKDKMVDAQQDRNAAMSDSYQDFKKESDTIIINYEKRIAELKETIATGSRDTKAAYEKKLAALELKYDSAKRKLREYKDDGKSEWKSFRNEFNRDMDDLGRSISHFFSNDKNS